MEIQGCKLVELTSACPEQYDVFKNGAQIGYLRLRNGQFRADFPDIGGRTVYEAEPKGDGVFEDDEREFYLNEAVSALLVELNK